MQHDETAPRQNVAADLGSEIMEFGDEMPEEELLTAAHAAAEEGRDQSVSGCALMRKGRDGAVDDRNDISRQDPQQDA